jgi:hypothetical protein
MALASTVSPKSMPFARMSASASSLVVYGPVASAAAQIAPGSPRKRSLPQPALFRHSASTNPTARPSASPAMSLQLYLPAMEAAATNPHPALNQAPPRPLPFQNP